MKIEFIHRLKDKHPRMWCVLVCIVLTLTIPLALLYEIVVGISVELLRKNSQLGDVQFFQISNCCTV